MNDGNSCYQNSALQCLLHSPKFFDYIKQLHTSEQCPRRTGQCLVCALLLRNGHTAGIQPKRLFVLAAEEYADNTAFVQPILRDIYSEFARVRSETLQGATPTEKVIELTESELCFYRRKIGAENTPKPGKRRARTNETTTGRDKCHNQWLQPNARGTEGSVALTSPLYADSPLRLVAQTSPPHPPRTPRGLPLWSPRRPPSSTTKMGSKTKTTTPSPSTSLSPSPSPRWPLRPPTPQRRRPLPVAAASLFPTDWDIVAASLLPTSCADLAATSRD